MTKASAPKIKVFKTANTFRRPYTVDVDGKEMVSAAGRTCRFATDAAAKKAAKKQIQAAQIN